MDKRDELDHLLARGRLSGPQRDRILETVQKRVHGGVFARSKYAIVGGALALAAALAIVVNRPATENRTFASKGTLRSSIELACSGGQLSACPRGSKLFFRFDAVPAAAFVHAYAEPTELGRERVWYYPTATNPPPRIDPAGEGRMLVKGVVIGAEHLSGHYRIHVILGSAPLSREELLHPHGANVLAVEAIDVNVVDP